MFRELAERRARHQDQPLFEWRDPPNHVRVTTAAPRCASTSLHSKEGGNVFVPVIKAGTTVLTGSARSLLDARVFTPDLLRGFRSSARPENELLLDAFGNQMCLVAKCVGGSWITCSGQAGCIALDVEKGLLTKAVLGLHSSLSIDWHHEGGRHPYSAVDDDDSMWEVEAVHALQLGPREEPSTFDCPNTNRSKRGKHDDRHFACLALCVNANSGDSPPNSRKLSSFPKTFEEVLRMCNSTQAKLSATEREQLKPLLPRYRAATTILHECRLVQRGSGIGATSGCYPPRWQGVHQDPAERGAPEEFPNSTNIRKLRSFLGIANYYRRFIQNHARIAKPLIQLTHANEKLEWNYSEQGASHHIKRAVVEVARLVHPAPDEPFLIDCDACKDGPGAVPAKADEQERERPIAFASRLLRPNESRWTTTELEANAVVWVLETFRANVEGSPTFVRTDSSPLPWGLSRSATGAPGAEEDLICYLEHRSEPESVRQPRSLLLFRKCRGSNKFL
ncbi:hypothetical protein Efla_004042 [Eimeria flavescens]